MNRSAPRRVGKGASFAPGESLIGLVRACAWDNRLPSVGTLLREAVVAPHAWSNLAARSDLDVGRLAAAMRIPEAEILSRMHPERRVAPNLTVASFFGADVRTHDLRLAGRVFAPGALETGAHHRALWQHGLLPFCLETGEPLLDRCARCGCRLEWGAAKPLNRCSHCRRPAKVGASAPVDATTLDAGRRLFGLVDPDRDRSESSCPAPHPDFAALPPGAAFDLCWSLGRLFCARSVGRREFDRLLDVDTRSAIARAGAEVLATWPEGVASTLRATIRRDLAEAKRIHRGIRALGSHRICWPEQHELLSARLPQLTGRTRRTLAEIHGAAYDGKSCLPVLRIAARLIPRLVAADAVDAVEVRPGSRLHVILDSASVERLGTLRRDCMPVGAASERLGISRHGIEQLLAAGLLCGHDDPAIGVMYKDRQISKASFERLCEAVRRSAVDRASVDGMALRRAVRQIGGRHKPWASLVGSMIEGRLTYALAATTNDPRRRTPLLDLVTLAPEDALAVMLAADGGGRDEAAPPMNRRDAEEVLNLTPRQLQDALADELSDAVLSDGRLDGKKVLHLARARISPAEISLRFGGGKRKLPTPLHKANLTRRGAAGWCRREVEAVCLGSAHPSPGHLLADPATGRPRR